MRLNRIIANNFLSYRNIDLTLPNDFNIYSIIGKNGAGKSSLIESILWCLFGKTNRNSLEKFIPNIQDSKKAKVSLFFDNENLKVDRQKNPPYFSYTNNNEVIRLQTITETQDSLDAFLNHNYKLFLVTSFFDDIFKNSFIDLSSEDKRQVIGTYFELDDFFTLRKKIRIASDRLKISINNYEFVKEYIGLHFDSKEISKIESLILSNTIEKSYIDFWVDALSDTGIIKNILSPLFDSITNKLNKYLKFLFDEEIFFSITADYENYLKISGVEIGVKSISSSQKKRLNLAIMLAMSELIGELRGSKLGNILIFDEFSGLDPFSKEKLAKLIKNLSIKNQIFLVTHDYELLTLIDSHTIEVKFEEGYSKITN